MILGPTASGKSDLAVELATAVGGEVISADSMQVYRGLDAGTAKPTPEQRRAVPHHLIDVVDPTERWTVNDWVREAERAIRAIEGRGRLPVVVGGTNLYVRSLLEGIFEGPPADPELRRSLAEVDGSDLHGRLSEVDPEAAGRIDPNDHKRLVRALEVYHLTGRPISDWQREWNEQRNKAYRHNPVFIGLHWPREQLNRRINARVKRMFHPPAGTEGLVEETRRLEEAGLLGPQAREALGTKQALAYLQGKSTLEDAVESTKIETRRFAKNQRTWLKRFRGVHWIDAAHSEFPAWVGEARGIVDQDFSGAR